MERFEEARRWFAQALRDLKAARDSLEDGNYEWSCFQSQQAAEKAVKALLYAYGRSSRGHSVVELLAIAREVGSLNEDLFIYARELDRHYIPSRYPNAFESGYPGMYYDEATARRALEAAEKIMRWVEKWLKSLGVEM
ncbi:MAG: HEPN domain-containing protein [Sulfolobales archaeon]